MDNERYEKYLLDINACQRTLESLASVARQESDAMAPIDRRLLAVAFILKNAYPLVDALTEMKKRMAELKK